MQDSRGDNRAKKEGVKARQLKGKGFAFPFPLGGAPIPRGSVGGVIMTGGSSRAFGVNSPFLEPGNANVGPLSAGSTFAGGSGGSPSLLLKGGAFSGGGGAKSHGRGTRAAGMTLQ